LNLLRVRKRLEIRLQSMLRLGYFANDPSAAVAVRDAIVVIDTVADSHQDDAQVIGLVVDEGEEWEPDAYGE